MVTLTEAVILLDVTVDEICVSFMVESICLKPLPFSGMVLNFLLLSALILISGYSSFLFSGASTESICFCLRHDILG